MKAHVYPKGCFFKSIDDIKDKHITVMGLGLNGGGEAVARFLLKHGAYVLVTDMKTEEQLKPTLNSIAFDDTLNKERLTYVLGGHRIEDFRDADCVIKNPGVKIQGNEFLSAAPAIETDISLFLQFTKAPIIAVTGSKGKSSTVSAIHYGLNKAGFKAFLGGNITVSAWDAEDLNAIGQVSTTVTTSDTINVGLIENPNKEIPENAIRFMPSELISDWMRPLSFPTVLVMRLNDENFDFSKAEKDGSDIRLYDGSGNLIPFEIDGWDTTINSATLNIRVENAADTVRPWMLMWGDKKAQKLKDIDVWEGLSDSLVKALNSVTIFDFEEGSEYNALPSPLHNYWYIQPHDSATISKALEKDPTSGIEKADSSIFGKNVLHVQYQANKLGRYVVLGTRIANKQHDLSRLDSVEVWLKGSGDFEVVLETIIESDTNYKTTYKGSVNEKWTRVAIKPSDFTSPDEKKSYHGWNVTRNKITRFTIFMYNGEDLWIDNAKMYGINLDDLL